MRKSTWLLIVAGLLAGCAPKPSLPKSIEMRSDKIEACYQVVIATRNRVVEEIRAGAYHPEEGRRGPAPECAELTLQEHTVAIERTTAEFDREEHQRSREADERYKTKVSAAQPHADKALNSWMRCVRQAATAFARRTSEPALAVVMAAYGSCGTEEGALINWESQAGGRGISFVDTLKTNLQPRLTAEIMVLRATEEKALPPKAIRPEI